MLTRIDRYIISRLFSITLFVLLVLIFIFIIIDFSENSDDFTDRGATFYEIFFDYYLHYIPEIIRLVSPVAIFVACLLLTGQLSDRLEITAMKAAGISLYRLLVPYFLFAFTMAGIIHYLDGYVVPISNTERVEFEREYIQKKSDRIDRNRIYRQESPNRYVLINYFHASEETAYRVMFYTFDGERLSETMEISRMQWNDEKNLWEMRNGEIRKYNDSGFEEITFSERDTTFSFLPRDIARTSSDVYQLTYPEIRDYLASIRRSGAGGIQMPMVQYYGKLTYPISIIVVTLIGVAIASVKRKGGRGVHIAAGLAISFLYLASMKMMEPFGHSGSIDPFYASLAPHLIFLFIGIMLLIIARK
ncbi:MAG: LptF/LptG family permease [Balneolales bacterium]